MKKCILGALALVSLLTACKKDDNNNNSGGSSAAGTITVGSTSYPQGGASGSGFSVAGNIVTASGYTSTGVATLTFEFPEGGVPAAGSYRIVSEDTTVGRGQVACTIGISGTGGTGTYGSTGAGTVNATVTDASGKLTIVVPNAPAASTTSGGTSTTFSANVTQP